MSEHEHQELDLTPVEGTGPVPTGWRILFWGLIAFGAYYLWAYTPDFTGWTQAAEVDGAAAGSGGSVFATILFTALAASAAGALLLALARRKR
ncbi:MAG TPA: hypothetical protein VEA99_12750 [Gemmatimonadaceae bacterium]|nr:hypothetical protein [Gemmatimonadaceae bacterium]